MNPETPQYAASAASSSLITGTGAQWGAEVNVPIPLRVGQCVPGIAHNRSALAFREIQPLLEIDTVCEIEFDWSQSILPCPGGGESTPTTCEACGGALIHISGCKSQCRQCGLTTGGCG